MFFVELKQFIWSLCFKRKAEKIFGDVVSPGPHPVTSSLWSPEWKSRMPAFHCHWWRKERTEFKNNSEALSGLVWATKPCQSQTCLQFLCPSLKSSVAHLTWASGMMSSTTTYTIAPAANAKAYGSRGSAKTTAKAPSNPATGSTIPLSWPYLMHIQEQRWFCRMMLQFSTISNWANGFPSPEGHPHGDPGPSQW